jgi:hypothetical protein
MSVTMPAMMISTDDGAEVFVVPSVNFLMNGTLGCISTISFERGPLGPMNRLSMYQ